MIILTFIMQIVAGILGSNLAARMNPRSDLGTFGNFLAGGIGGFAGGQLLSLLGMHIFIADSHMDLTGTIVNIIGSGISGGVFINLITTLREVISGKSS